MTGMHVGATALLGREREQAELYDALSLASKGDPQVVVVAGDAGTGKTTLVSDLAGRAAELGFAVAVGHCLDIEADISFAPVVEALRSLLAGVEDLESRPFARRMHALLDPETPRSEQRHLLEDLRLAVLEAAALGTGAARAGGRALGGPVDPGSRRGALAHRTWPAVARAHRAQPTTSIAGTRLARRSPRSAGLPGRRRVDLGPWAGTASPPSWRRSRRARPSRRWSGRCWSAPRATRSTPRRSPPPVPGRFPSQLADLFLARIDALPEGPRALARTASVDGTRVDVETLGRAGGSRPRRLDAFLRELLEANILRSAWDTLAFRHPLLREAVYDDLLPDERARLHAELAAHPASAGRRGSGAAVCRC